MNPHTATCAKCGAKWKEDDLNTIKDLSVRVVPGEIMPSGECPACRSLCHRDEYELPIVDKSYVPGSTYDRFAWAQLLTFRCFGGSEKRLKLGDGHMMLPNDPSASSPVYYQWMLVYADNHPDRPGFEERPHQRQFPTPDDAYDWAAKQNLAELRHWAISGRIPGEEEVLLHVRSWPWEDAETEFVKCLHGTEVIPVNWPTAGNSSNGLKYESWAIITGRIRFGGPPVPPTPPA